MKKLLSVFIIALFFTDANAQSWQNEIKDPSNFYSIRQAYLDYTQRDKNEKEI